MQRALIVIGITIALVGVGWPWLSKLPLGRMPGDIIIDRENYRFYSPFTTMVVVSLLLSALFWILRR